jgi:hypothetical protein
MGSAPFAHVVAHAENRQLVARPQPVVMGSASSARVTAHAGKRQVARPQPVVMGSAPSARVTAHAGKRQVARPQPVVMGSAPFARVAAHAEKWQQIGATPSLLHWIRYGVHLPWTGVPRSGFRREYPLSPDDHRFASSEMDRWVHEGFAEDISEAEVRKIGVVVSGFVFHGAKRRVVVDYTTQNEVLGARKLKMDTQADLAPQLRTGDALFKADVQDAYYHLRIRRGDRDKLLFRIAGRWFRPLALNCGLSPAPRLFTKFLRPWSKSYDDSDTASFRTWKTSQERHVPTMGTLRQARTMPHGRAGKFESCLGNWG